MTNLLATKTGIKRTYIQALQTLYPFYTDGSRPLDLAYKAADAALAGHMRLEGNAWYHALEMHGLGKHTTMKTLVELPE